MAEYPYVNGQEMKASENLCVIEVCFPVILLLDLMLQILEVVPIHLKVTGLLFQLYCLMSGGILLLIWSSSLLN